MIMPRGTPRPARYGFARPVQPAHFLPAIAAHAWACGKTAAGRPREFLSAGAVERPACPRIAAAAAAFHSDGDPPMKIRNLPRLFVVATAAFVLTPVLAPARAGLLAPGQAGGGEPFRLNLAEPSFAGDTLTSSSTPFEFTAPGPDDPADLRFMRGN